MKKTYAWFLCLLLLAGMSLGVPASAQEAFSFSVPRESLDTGKQKDLSELLQNGEAAQWSSSDESVAVVDDAGVVTGTGLGAADITARTASGQSAVCRVTVGLYTGIDLSYANGAVDWDAIKEDGIDFAMMRSSYGWYDDLSQPQEYQFDEQFIRNVEEARRVGMPFGLYHYSYAASENEASWEAEYLKLALAAAGVTPDNIQLPIVWDVEDPSIMSDLEEMGKSRATQVLLVFFEEMRKDGYEVMLYTSKAHFSYYFDVNALDEAGVHLWMAWWQEPLDLSTITTIDGVAPIMWQYMSDGQVAGVSTDVDMDVLYMSAWDLGDKGEESQPVPDPDPQPGPNGMGDVDGNGSVTAADALLALQAATGKLDLTDIQQSAADVDGNDGVSASDALAILQYATKKIDTFPAE